MGFLRVVGKSLATTLIFFLLAELGLRAAYAGRNALVSFVPLPYVVGDDYGPIPPWLDNLLILKPDDVHSSGRTCRTPVALTSTSSRPVWKDSDRVALLRRFAPWLPEAFRRNPVWRISLNEDGFRNAPIAGQTSRACSGSRVSAIRGRSE